MDMDEIQDWLHMAANGTRPGTLPLPGSDIAAWLNSVNASVTQVTGGSGALRTLVPLTLAFLGLRSLLLTEQLPFPAWYDYLWFAFSTYMILHIPRATSA
jgi:hypothetical protein